MQDLTPREKFMAADPEMYRDELKEMAANPAARELPGSHPLPGEDPEEVANALSQISTLTAEQASRMTMVAFDPILRRLPFEQRTAVLLNLLVTYIGEEPAILAARGKSINALTEDFKMRLQRYLPVKTDA